MRVRFGTITIRRSQYDTQETWESEPEPVHHPTSEATHLTKGRREKEKEEVTTNGDGKGPDMGGPRQSTTYLHKVREEFQRMLVENPGHPSEWSLDEKLRLLANSFDQIDAVFGRRDMTHVQEDLRRAANIVQAAAESKLKAVPDEQGS